MIIRTKIFISSLLLGLLSSLQSCSNEPNFKEFEVELEMQIALESDDEIKLVALEKTNSIDQEVLGQKVNKIHYQAKIEFLKDCWVYINKSGTGSMFQNFKTYDIRPEFIPGTGSIAQEFKKGQEVEYSSEVIYVETENGWVVQKPVSLL